MRHPLHNAEAAHLLASALAEQPLNARQRRIILKYLHYAVHGAELPRRVACSLTTSVAFKGENTTSSENNDQTTIGTSRRAA